MTVTRKISVALCAAALVTGVGAVQANASAASGPSAVHAQLGAGHWGPYKHSPTKYWATADFVPNGRHLRGYAGCWSGGDGTRYRIQLVRTKDKHVRRKSGWFFCNDGRWESISTTVRAGEAYYMRIELKGKAHTVQAKATWF
ncbi:hypothetical protein Skr01_57030 [Sphaerisporangium krabiense]|nr:hypothetical protein Skr01_57030 [Sphaerisporangium krabiense]